MSTIRNKQDFFGNEDHNHDGSPVQEIVDDDGNVTGTIREKWNDLGLPETNQDGSEVKEIV